MILTGANPKELDDVVPRFTYAGDAIRLAAGPTLLDDDFYNGAPWRVSCRNIEPDLQFNSLIISILSLHKDAPIYLEDGRRLTFLTNGQMSELLQVEAIPRYGLAMKTGR